MVILKALTDPKAGWQNHPATKMWRGYEVCLTAYGCAVCVEWVNRGYKDNSYEKILDFLQIVPIHTEIPPWFGDEVFHSSHRAALLAKEPEWYGQFGWSEEPKIEYVWPV